VVSSFLCRSQQLYMNSPDLPHSVGSLLYWKREKACIQKLISFLHRLLNKSSGAELSEISSSMWRLEWRFGRATSAVESWLWLGLIDRCLESLPKVKFPYRIRSSFPVSKIVWWLCRGCPFITSRLQQRTRLKKSLWTLNRFTLPQMWNPSWKTLYNILKIEILTPVLNIKVTVIGNLWCVLGRFGDNRSCPLATSFGLSVKNPPF
jgi:hypothetical protein